jgi:hypothetical protein
MNWSSSTSAARSSTPLSRCPSFADTGEAYLVGLAVTDNPASLGTEMLVRRKNPDANPFKHRKEQPDDVFSVAEPLTLELEDESAGIVASFKGQHRCRRGQVHRQGCHR